MTYTNEALRVLQIISIATQIITLYIRHAHEDSKRMYYIYMITLFALGVIDIVMGSYIIGTFMLGMFLWYHNDRKLWDR